MRYIHKILLQEIPHMFQIEGIPRTLRFQMGYLVVWYELMPKKNVECKLCRTGDAIKDNEIIIDTAIAPSGFEWHLVSEMSYT